MATNFSPCKGSYVLNQFPSNVMFGMNGFHVSASGAIHGHHGPLVLTERRAGIAYFVHYKTFHELGIFTSLHAGKQTSPLLLHTRCVPEIMSLVVVSWKTCTMSLKLCQIGRVCIELLHK